MQQIDLIKLLKNLIKKKDLDFWTYIWPYIVLFLCGDGCAKWQRANKDKLDFLSWMVFTHSLQN